MKINLQSDIIEDLTGRKQISREYLRSLAPTEKIEKLVKLQHHYYELLSIREQNGGRPIPEKWRKWRSARFEIE